MQEFYKHVTVNDISKHTKIFHCHCWWCIEPAGVAHLYKTIKTIVFENDILLGHHNYSKTILS